MLQNPRMLSAAYIRAVPESHRGAIVYVTTTLH